MSDKYRVLCSLGLRLFRSPDALWVHIWLDKKNCVKKIQLVLFSSYQIYFILVCWIQLCGVIISMKIKLLLQRAIG